MFPYGFGCMQQAWGGIPAGCSAAYGSPLPLASFVAKTEALNSVPSALLFLRLNNKYLLCVYVRHVWMYMCLCSCVCAGGLYCSLHVEVRGQLLVWILAF